MKYSEMIDYCESNRDKERFCRVSCACSGPCVSNLAKDRPFPEGVTIYRGGDYGSCRFEVEEER